MKAYIRDLSNINPDFSGCSVNLSEEELTGDFDMVVEDVSTLPKCDPLLWSIENGSIKFYTSQLEQLKSGKWEKAKNLRTIKYDENLETPEGLWQVDAESRSSISSALLTLNEDSNTISWLDSDNNLVTLSKVQLNSILVEHALRKNTIFNAFMNIKSDIDDCTTIDSINDLDVESLLNTYIA